MRWIYEKKKMICAAAAIVLAVLVTGVTAEKKGMLAQARLQVFKEDGERSISFPCACK